MLTRANSHVQRCPPPLPVYWPGSTSVHWAGSTSVYWAGCTLVYWAGSTLGRSQDRQERRTCCLERNRNQLRMPGFYKERSCSLPSSVATYFPSGYLISILYSLSLPGSVPCTLLLQPSRRSQWLASAPFSAVATFAFAFASFPSGSLSARFSLPPFPEATTIKKLTSLSEGIAVATLFALTVG